MKRYMALILVGTFFILGRVAFNHIESCKATVYYAEIQKLDNKLKLADSNKLTFERWLKALDQNVVYLDGRVVLPDNITTTTKESN